MSESKNKMTWIQAVKACRDSHVFSGKIPKKGSEAYLKIKKVMKSGKVPKIRKARKAKAKKEDKME